MFEWILGDWRTIGFIALSTVLIYVSTVAVLRFTERRTLAEMSSFDLVVVVAFGSIVGRTATAARPSYAQAIAALVTLLVLHHLASWLRLRSAAVRRATDRRAVVLVEVGQLRSEALAEVHLTEADVWRVMRQHGIRDIASLDLLVIEGSGRFSLYRRDEGPIDPRLLAGLHRPGSNSV
jgi:uncharacterized membrane protein YcaP (DUF421 family)